MALSAITLTGLLLFSSVVFDLGALMLARRQDQAAADAAALGGVMDRYNESALVATVVEILNHNLNGANFTAADMNTCAPEHLASGWSRYGSANCLAHDDQWREIQVRIPTRSISTFFGQLAGVNELDHTAFAQAQATTTASMMPFLVESGAGSHECLKSGASVPAPDCSDQSNGSFGDLDMTLFGTPELGTTKKCTGTTNQYINNLAVGIDHLLSRYSVPGPETIDAVACGLGEAHQYRPNAAAPGTGNQPGQLAEGLIGDLTFSDGGPSRLRRTSTLTTFSSVSVKTNDWTAPLDDTPLWDFIPDGLDSSDDVPESCWRDQFIGPDGGLDTNSDLIMASLPTDVETHLATFSTPDRMIKLMERCLTHYEGGAWDDHGAFTGVDSDYGLGCIGTCDDPLFTVNTTTETHDLLDIQHSPRFSHVPQILSSEQIHDALVHFERFPAVYLHRLYLNCSTTACDGVFDPGVGWTFNKPHKQLNSVDALSAFILPPGTLPNGLGEPDGYERHGASIFAELTR